MGILLSGFDSSSKPHIYELSPGGDCVEYVGYAIGAKSQSAKTYLEKYYQHFDSSDINQLIMHGLSAIKSGYRDEKEEMSEKNIEIAVIS